MKRTFAWIFVGLLVAALLVSAPALVRAATVPAAPAAPAAVAAAEQLYNQGNYAVAAASYRQLVDQGVADARVFYNMGLAYRQAGELGQALWSLRSAANLDPRDPDLRTALAEVRAQLAAEAPEIARVPAEMALPGRVAALTSPLLTADELSWLAVSLWIVVALLLLLALLAGGEQLPRIARRTVVLVGVGLVAVLVLWGSRIAVPGQVAAVVVTPGVELRSGPGASFAARTTLPVGAEVVTAETRGPWVQVVLPGGAVGWAPAESVATISG